MNNLFQSSSIKIDVNLAASILLFTFDDSEKVYKASINADY